MLVHRYFTSQLHYSVYLEIRRSCNLHASAQSPRQCQGAISPSSASSRHFLFHLQEREQQQQLVPSNGHHKVVFIYYFVAHSLNKVSTEQHEVKFSVINWIPLRFHLTYWPFGKEDVLQRACTYYIHIKGVLFNIKQINFAIIELRFNKCVPLNRIHLAGITQSQITTAPSNVPRFSQPLYLWSCLRIYPQIAILLWFSRAFTHEKSFRIPATIHRTPVAGLPVVGWWWRQSYSTAIKAKLAYPQQFDLETCLNCGLIRIVFDFGNSAFPATYKYMLALIEVNGGAGMVATVLYWYCCAG